MTHSIRAATATDLPIIRKFIMDLATYERLAHEMEATEADLARDLFGASPRVFCDIALWNGEPVGFALWYYTFSTFQGRHGLWLEDLFIDPDARGNGVGQAVLKHLAQRCLDENLGRLEWNVLDWNEPAIKFYEARGASFMDEWRRCRVSGEALEHLAGA